MTGPFSGQRRVHSQTSAGGPAGAGPSRTTVVDRHLGAAHAVPGHPAEAREYDQKALRVATDMRFPPEIALTRFELAEPLLEHFPEERAQPMEHLGFAVGEFRKMKMAPTLEKATKLKESLGEQCCCSPTFARWRMSAKRGFLPGRG